MPLQLKKVTQGDLKDIIEEHGSIRVGVTTRIDDRMCEYQDEGYTGTMYYADTENMWLAENRLLRIRIPLHNEQEESNAQEEKGWVYVISGQRRA
jgi:hypothetical protein